MEAHNSRLYGHFRIEKKRGKREREKKNNGPFQNDIMIQQEPELESRNIHNRYKICKKAFFVQYLLILPFYQMRP